MSNRFVYIYLILVLVGFGDAAYLAALHFYQADPGCSLISGCDAVLSSEYSVILGIPLAYAGLAYYLFLMKGILFYFQYGSLLALKATQVVNSAGFIMSMWLVYLQAFVINSFCQYCLLSALVTSSLLITMWIGTRRYVEEV